MKTKKKAQNRCACILKGADGSIGNLLINLKLQDDKILELRLKILKAILTTFFAIILGQHSSSFINMSAITIMAVVIGSSVAVFCAILIFLKFYRKKRLVRDRKLSKYDSSENNEGNLYQINPNKQHHVPNRHTRSQPTIEEIQNSLQDATTNEVSFLIFLFSL